MSSIHEVRDPQDDGVSALADESARRHRGNPKRDGRKGKAFTKRPNDNFKSSERTSKNPLNLSVISGQVEGKEREQFTIQPPNKAKNCIRETLIN